MQDGKFLKIAWTKSVLKTDSPMQNILLQSLTKGLK